MCMDKKKVVFLLSHVIMPILDALSETVILNFLFWEKNESSSIILGQGREREDEKRASVRIRKVRGLWISREKLLGRKQVSSFYKNAPSEIGLSVLERDKRTEASKKIHTGENHVFGANCHKQMTSSGKLYNA